MLSERSFDDWECGKWNFFKQLARTWESPKVTKVGMVNV